LESPKVVIKKSTAHVYGTGRRRLSLSTICGIADSPNHGKPSTVRIRTLAQARLLSNCRKPATADITGTAPATAAESTATADGLAIEGTPATAADVPQKTIVNGYNGTRIFRKIFVINGLTVSIYDLTSL
jgi:hypothetical protein